MADNPDFGKDGRIHISEVQELRYWTKKLGVSSDALISAVRAVGSNVDRVQEYIRTHKV
ncbi:MAG: DUF3606 domain-containing protein [Bdellovibrionota bacterium]